MKKIAFVLILASISMIYFAVPLGRILTVEIGFPILMYISGITLSFAAIVFGARLIKSNYDYVSIPKLLFIGNVIPLICLLFSVLIYMSITTGVRPLFDVFMPRFLGIFHSVVLVGWLAYLIIDDRRKYFEEVEKICGELDATHKESPDKKFTFFGHSLTYWQICSQMKRRTSFGKKFFRAYNEGGLVKKGSLYTIMERIE